MVGHVRHGNWVIADRTVRLDVINRAASGASAHYLPERRRADYGETTATTILCSTSENPPADHLDRVKECLRYGHTYPGSLIQRLRLADTPAFTGTVVPIVFGYARVRGTSLPTEKFWSNTKIITVGVSVDDLFRKFGQQPGSVRRLVRSRSRGTGEEPPAVTAIRSLSCGSIADAFTAVRQRRVAQLLRWLDRRIHPAP